MTTTVDRWRRVFRCAPDSPRREQRREKLQTRPLGLYAAVKQQQDSDYRISDAHS